MESHNKHKRTGKMGFIRFTQCGVSVINVSNHWVLSQPEQVQNEGYQSWGYTHHVSKNTKQLQHCNILALLSSWQGWKKFSTSIKITRKCVVTKVKGQRSLLTCKKRRYWGNLWTGFRRRACRERRETSDFSCCLRKLTNLSFLCTPFASTSMAAGKLTMYWR